MVNHGFELVKICAEKNMPIWEYTLEDEANESGLGKEEIFENMRKSLKVMEEAAEYGTRNEVRSISGIIGGDGFKLNSYAESGKTLTGKMMVKAMARALACAEVNASMGRIVAAPTAGSCGIVPATLITACESLEKSEDDMVKALFTAAGVGIIIAKNATLAGAEGGCQAECGSAAAMASAAVVEMMGGTPEQALNAAAIVFKNILGLVCDPVAGLVEVPCAKRNAAGVVSALTTADMVMGGVSSKIPFDEVVEAMYKIGKSLPCELRETAQGGLAVTETDRKSVV